jgi:hypothetical protein
MTHSNHRFTVSLAIVALAAAPMMLAQNAPVSATSAQGPATNVNYTTIINVSDQGTSNSCYTPTAAQLANPACGVDQHGNPVQGEWVALAGSITTVYHNEIDPDGDHLHLKMTSHSELTGMGSCSGAKYVEKDDYNNDYKLKANDAGTVVKTDFLTLDKMKLVSQGPLPNMTVVFQTHTIVDEIGNVTIVKTFPNAQGQTTTKCTK